MTGIHRTIVAAALVAAGAGTAGAQQQAGKATVAAPVGVWRGTSVCLVRGTACKDEVVVYHIARTGPDSAGIAPLRISANKIVNGAELEMGDLECRFTPATAQLLCPMPPQYARGDWRFTLVGTQLDGGLWMASGEQFREVHVKLNGPAPRTPRGG